VVCRLSAPADPAWRTESYFLEADGEQGTRRSERQSLFANRHGRRHQILRLGIAIEEFPAIGTPFRPGPTGRGDLPFAAVERKRAT